MEYLAIQFEPIKVDGSEVQILEFLHHQVGGVRVVHTSERPTSAACEVRTCVRTESGHTVIRWHNLLSDQTRMVWCLHAHDAYRNESHECVERGSTEAARTCESPALGDE